MTTTIITKNSSTAGAAPLAADLVQGELAVNVTSKALYTKNASAAVVKLNTPSIVDNGNATAITIDSSENVGVGVTPSAWATTNGTAIQGYGWSLSTPASGGFNTLAIASNAYNSASVTWNYKGSAEATMYQQFAGSHRWFTAPSGTAGNAISFTQALTLDGNGNLLVGTTTAGAGIGFDIRLAVDGGSGEAGIFKTSGGASSYSTRVWNSATTGNNLFTQFATEANGTTRGSITYNRGGGLTAYNVTSDYRSKTVNGPVQDALSKVSALKPSTGRMNGAEYDIDFFVAHELQVIVPSAVTGEKDDVNEDGSPKYQMVDKSALIPLLTAAIQEQQAIINAQQAALTTLTERITALEAK